MEPERASVQWLYCFRCKGRKRCIAGTCQSCGESETIVGWQCKRCNRIVRGPAPDGPLVCGQCPEPLATWEEITSLLNDSGDPITPGDTTLDECRECHATIRRTNNLPRGAAICIQCEVGSVVKCAHPNHRGCRDVKRHMAQLGTYIHRTKAQRESRRTDTLCFACFSVSGAVHPTEVACIPALALVEEAPYQLQRSPRDSYEKTAVIFDATGAAAIDEKRVIRLNAKSFKFHEYKFKPVQWFECEELRLTGSTVENRLSVTFNQRAVRAVHRQIEAKRAAQHAFNEAHKANSRLCVNPSTIDAASLGWFAMECIGLNERGQASFRVEYPSIARDETTAQWAYRVLK